MTTPSQLRQSIAWWCFVPEFMTPAAFVRAVAAAGYAAIELAPPAHWALIREHGLALSGIGGHGPLTVGLNRREHHDRIEQEVLANLALAQEWGIPNLICFSGNRDGLDDQRGAENTAQGLARLAPAAEAAGVTLVLELLNSKVDHPDYQADHTAWALPVIQQVNSPRIQLLYDIYHMQVMEGDVIRTLRAAAPWIGHYHTAGNPGRNDLDETQELYYPAIWRAIAATGYTGYVVHEFLPKGDPVAAIQQTFDQFASL